MYATQRSVVVVEDERDILDMVCMVLEDDGFDALCLDCSAEVIERVDANRADMFLLDLMMPEIDGISLARQLRENGFLHTPIIAMSASPYMLQQATASGLFQGTLTKPFDLKELLLTVEQHAAA